VIKDIDQSKQLVKVTLITEEEIALNLRGIEEEDMSKLEIEHYAVPGTLVNTKVIKKLSNGLMVKFLKIFIGFIHADHLVRPLDSYTNDEKMMARIIYQCNNPPMIFLSERHKTIKTY
jgi:ribosomal protein S1